MRKSVVAALLFLFLVSNFLHAQVLIGKPPSNWSDLRLHAGETVVLIFEGGPKVKGQIDLVTEREITVSKKKFLKDQVVRVEATKRDPINNGMFLGLVVGGVGSAAALYARHGGSPRPTDVAGGVLGMAVGLIAGGLVDRSFNPGTEILYQRP
jgi:hypothetical protein